MNNYEHIRNIRRIIYLIIYLLSILVFSQSKIVILPFDHLIEKNKNSSSYYDIKNYFIESINNKMHFKLKIGKPEQIMSCISKTEKYFDFIQNEKCPENKGENYNPSKSSTYSNTIKYLDSNLNLINETIKLNIDNKEKEIRDFQLLINKQCNYSEINLLMSNDSEIYELRQMFINQLKDKKIIDKIIISIDYINKDNGNLYLGNYPHLFKNSPFKQYKFMIINNIASLKIKNKFNIIMNSMFFIKKVESDFKKIADFTINEPLEFVYDSDFIFAGVKYINEIDDNFFKKYRDNNICFFRTITIKPNMFILFECLKSNKYTEFSVNEFPTLYLYNKKLNYTFELTYKDLFEEINDIYYFLIAYDLRDTNEWKLGKPFLKKYTFVFDSENQTIGFYDKNNIIEIQDDEIDKKIKQNNSKSLNIIVLIILLAFFNFLLIVLIYKINKNCNKRRKKKIYELKDNEEDDFYYESKNDSKIPINSS